MGSKKLKYTRSSDVTDGRTKSLILEIDREDGAHIAHAFCRDNEWRIVFGDKEEVKLKWEEFLEIFHQITTFLVGENELMLHECEETLRNDNLG